MNYQHYAREIAASILSEEVGSLPCPKLHLMIFSDGLLVRATGSIDDRGLDLLLDEIEQFAEGTSEQGHCVILFSDDVEQLVSFFVNEYADSEYLADEDIAQEDLRQDYESLDEYLVDLRLENCLDEEDEEELDLEDEWD